MIPFAHFDQSNQNQLLNDVWYQVLPSHVPYGMFWLPFWGQNKPMVRNGFSLVRLVNNIKIPAQLIQVPGLLFFL